MSSEKEFIEICKTLIEEKFHFQPGELWKQRDFEYLVDLIFEKTGTRLSISTLKRIWKDPDTHMPQTYTLNILAVFSGFESWSDFKQQQKLPTKPVKEKTRYVKKGVKISKIIYLILFSILIIGSFLFFYFSNPGKSSFNESNVIFKSRKSVASGVPNTVVFEYDISKIDFDSAFIQHSWDARLRAKVSKNNHFQTFIYYYPGYHTAKLIINDKVVKKEYVNITTLGWEAVVDGISHDSLPQYIARDDIFHDNELYVSKQALEKNGVHVGDRPFWINYFNVGKFKEAYGENFTLRTRIKNNLKDGGLVCQYCQVSIICENGMLSIPFCNPGCAANIHLHISDVVKQGRDNDLTPFGTDLSVWRNIKIVAIKKQVAVYIDDMNVYNIPFTKDLGRITGFHYKFYGCGAVNMVKLYNAKNELCFDDGFSVNH